MPSRREVLEQLKRDELIAALDATGLEVDDLLTGRVRVTALLQEHNA